MIKSKIFTVFEGVCLALTIVIILYSYSPYKLEFFGYHNKIWAHRVNSIEKLNSALEYYNGFEVDLVYNESEDFFDVNHAPAKSINLHFETYINTSTNINKAKGIWLDIKNLNQNNAQKILKRITKIFNNKNISLNNVIIESRFPEALSIFSEQGFKTSFYLPYNLHQKQENELYKSINQIKKVLRSQPNLAISSNHRDYEIMKKYFPDTEKYIWALVYTLNLEFLTTKKILKDDKVKVVLVNYNALKGNR